MRKGTGAAFVIMPDDREGKMVLEYVRWWHPLTFSYFSQGINKLLTFKEQQFPDQERVGSRSPLPPEPTYGPIPEQGQPPRSSQHRKGHQPRQKQTRTMKGKGGSAPVSQHASPVREERRVGMWASFILLQLLFLLPIERFIDSTTDVRESRQQTEIAIPSLA